MFAHAVATCRTQALGWQGGLSARTTRRGRYLTSGPTRRSAKPSTGIAGAVRSSLHPRRASPGNCLIRDRRLGIVGQRAGVCRNPWGEAHDAQETLWPETPRHAQVEAVGEDASHGTPDPVGQRIRCVPAQQRAAKTAGQEQQLTSPVARCQPTKRGHEARGRLLDAAQEAAKEGAQCLHVWCPVGVHRNVSSEDPLPHTGRLACPRHRITMTWRECSPPC